VIKWGIEGYIKSQDKQFTFIHDSSSAVCEWERQQLHKSRMVMIYKDGNGNNTPAKRLHIPTSCLATLSFTLAGMAIIG
jgi:hypothetical protein